MRWEIFEENKEVPSYQDSIILFKKFMTSYFCEEGADLEDVFIEGESKFCRAFPANCKALKAAGFFKKKSREFFLKQYNKNYWDKISKY